MPQPPTDPSHVTVLTAVGAGIASLFIGITGWFGRRHIERIDTLEDTQKTLLRTCATRDDVRDLHHKIDDFKDAMIKEMRK